MLRRRIAACVAARLAPAVGAVASAGACIVSIAAVVGMGGCASPTLPLPPPDEIAVAQGPDADHVRLSGPCGSALQNAIIVVVNENPSVPLDMAVGGALTSSCGGWDAVVYAHHGDVLDVTQQLNGTVSIPRTVGVP